MKTIAKSIIFFLLFGALFLVLPKDTSHDMSTIEYDVIKTRDGDVMSTIECDVMRSREGDVVTIESESMVNENELPQLLRGDELFAFIAVNGISPKANPCQ